jgi:hypothetical protein
MIRSPRMAYPIQPPVLVAELIAGEIGRTLGLRDDGSPV